MYSKRNLSPTCKFIRLCLASAQPILGTDQLLKGHHGEDCYRMHLYFFVVDKAFMNYSEFKAKRSECLSSITKLFDDLPNQRIDFILRNLNDENDYLSAEEKPTVKGVKGDLEKAKSLQKLMLTDWSRRIGSEKLMTEFEAITCQWQGTK
jgi:hypothetical protein